MKSLHDTSKKPLSVALLGLNEIGLAMWHAMRESTAASLWAVGDDRPEALRAWCDEHPVPVYTDFRSLVVESVPKGLDLLIVALEPFQTVECLAVAADLRLPVLFKTPPVRNVRDARRLLDAFDAARKTPVVARWWMFEPALAGLRDFAAMAGHVYAAHGDVAVCDSPESWRGDRGKSGGGVLLNGGYDLVDMLVTALGTPESVFAQCTASSAPGITRKYDTEDAAVACFRCPGDAVSVVTARRGAPVASWSVRLVGERQTAEVTAKGVAISSGGGGKSRRHRIRTALRYGPFMQALASFLADEPVRFDSTLRDHLPTIATIEAAYLSSRTGQPESPARLLDRS